MPSPSQLRSIAFGSLSICIALAASVAFSGGCATSGSTTSPGIVRNGDSVSFPVEGMACPNCAKEVEHALQQVPGVKAAAVDFKSSRATVTLSAEHAATVEQLQGAVAAWHKEHFTQEEDPNCLDPAKRQEMQKKGA